MSRPFSRPWMRQAILTLGGNPMAVGLASRFGLALGAGRFVAGKTVADAVATVEQLNQQGLSATLDHLGESVQDEDRARNAAVEYLELLQVIDQHRLNANVSIKPTQMGLEISKDLCLENVRAIVAAAAGLGNFVRIDMEDFPHVQVTVDMFRTLRQDFDNVGLAVQAYLYRSLKDVEDLAPLTPNLRIVKGAYDEPGTVAFPDKRDVDENFRQLVALNLHHGGYTAVATHDPRLIEFTLGLISRLGYQNLEFQMLYGIRPDLQSRLADQGYRVRVYVPYGTDWFPYFVRRLAERPANLAFFLSNLRYR